MRILLPGRSPSHVAVLFDVDGTLCDSLPLHFEAYVQALDEIGGPGEPGGQRIEWSDYVAHCLRAGRRFEELPAVRELGIDSQRLLTVKTRRYRALAAERLRPKVGLRELWTALRARGVLLGVASTARRASVEISLGACRLSGAPEVVIAREDVGDRVKPDPWCYALAAQRLFAAPEACLTFDDAPAGVAAALAAGMLSIGLRNAVFADHELAAAAGIIDDFTEIEIRDGAESLQVERNRGLGAGAVDRGAGR